MPSRVTTTLDKRERSDRRYPVDGNHHVDLGWTQPIRIVWLYAFAIVFRQIGRVSD